MARLSGLKVAFFAAVGAAVVSDPWLLFPLAVAALMSWDLL